MPLNESRGNMYPFVDFTWNTIKGECPHHCTYCYMKKWGPQKPARFDERELKTDLGEGCMIFIGSSCDMFSHTIPLEWVIETLEKANRYKNNYLLQTKDPSGYRPYLEWIDPARYTLATTIETNLHIPEIMGDSPTPDERTHFLSGLANMGYRTMVTIEPIMKFDLEQLLAMIDDIRPYQVNIGADSGGNGLPEPTIWEIEQLIYALGKKGITVRDKINLNRLIPV